MKKKIHLSVFILLFFSKLYSQETILKIGFEKEDTTRLYQYSENDIYPVSQTLNDKRLGNMGKYYGDTISTYRNYWKYLSFADFYGGIATDSMIKYESTRGKVFLGMNLYKLIDYEDKKVYGNGMVYYKLKKKLKKGSKYMCSLDYSVRNKSTNINVNCFGFLFIKDPEGPLNTYNYLQKEPHVYSKDFLKIQGSKWNKLEGEFIADDNYETMILGFFETKNIFKIMELSVPDDESFEFKQMQNLRIIVDDIEIKLLER